MNFSKAIFIREFEKLLLDLFSKGKLNGTVHTCVGQETIPVAISSHFKKGDRIFSNHRGHGHFLSVDGDAKRLLAEMLGKKSGISSGIGGSQHLYNENFISNGIQAGLTPIAAGYSYVNKLKGNDNISIVYIGDGTMGEGLVYEALNLSSINACPTLFVLENNGYAQSTPFKYIKRGSIEDRVRGFNVKYFKTSIWNSDFEDKIESAIQATRKGEPVFIEIECYRLNPHSKGDDNRDTDEIARYVEKDPINTFYDNNKVEAQVFENDAKSTLNAYLEEIEQTETLSTMPEHRFIINEPVKKRSCDGELDNKRINKLISEGLNEFLDNSDTIFIGEDIMNTTEFTPGQYGGAFKVSGNLSDIYQNRVFNTPICEASIIGFVIGAALNGFKPIAEIMFGDFLTLGFDQILQQASKIPEMFGQKVNLPVILRTPMGGRRGYGPTHSQNIEKHFLFIPNIRVLAQNSFINPKQVYNTLYRENKIFTLLVEDKISYTKNLFYKMVNGYETFISDEQFPTLFFSPKKVQPNVTVFCYGGMLDELVDALEELFIEEIYPEIICPIQISPFNINPLLESIKATNKLFIIEEGSKYGALSSEILSYILQNKVSLDKVERMSNECLIPCSKIAEMNIIPNTKLIVDKLNIFIND